MLNEKGTRELCYIIKISEIRPIAGRDRVECAVVGGWTVMVRKGQFKPGDLGIYLEIDSCAPEKEPFMFLESKHFKIKTQKYKTPDGQFWSQGLLMSADDFGWTLYTDGDGTQYIHDPKNNQSMPEGTFLTEKLGITYAVAEDNARKANSADKYKKMAQRNNKLFAHQPLRWLMRRDWGKKLLFVFFGRKRDRKASWPIWVSKTDEERVQNMPWILQNKEPWVATEKIDGSSTTFTMKRGKRRKNEFFVCSRNVVFDKPEKPCYYDTNIYLEMAEKYHVEEVLNKILLEHPEYDWVTIQGETYGDGVQKRDYSLGRIAKDSDGKISGHDFMAFNFITSDKGRWNSLEGKEFLNKYGIPWVPIVDSNFILPDTIEELLSIATGDSVVDGGMREGLVFRSQDGAQSFKAVSNEFLLRFHS